MGDKSTIKWLEDRAAKHDHEQKAWLGENVPTGTSGFHDALTLITRLNKRIEELEQILSVMVRKGMESGAPFAKEARMSKLEHCHACGLPTGHAGAGEDSHFCVECEAGPFCDDCVVLKDDCWCPNCAEIEITRLDERIEEAETLIAAAVQIMTPEQVGQWWGVRAWQEGVHPSMPVGKPPEVEVHLAVYCPNCSSYAPLIERWLDNEGIRTEELYECTKCNWTRPPGKDLGFEGVTTIGVQTDLARPDFETEEVEGE